MENKRLNRQATFISLLNLLYASRHFSVLTHIHGRFIFMAGFLSLIGLYLSLKASNHGIKWLCFFINLCLLVWIIYAGFIA